jgi:hypothetical protein
MASKKKIALRVLLLGGVGYLFYRNKDRIFGKIDKLSRMNTTDEIIDDLGSTTNKALDGIIDGADEMYNYLVGFVGIQTADEKPNEAFNKELFAIGKDLKPNYASQLRNIASGLVNDIRGWDNSEYQTADFHVSETAEREGEMPVANFIVFSNFYNLKGEGDFEKVVEMANVLLQYKAPYDLKHDTVRDASLPTLDYYIDNPTSKYTQYDKINNYIFESTGRGTPSFDHKPRGLFKAIGDKIRSKGLARTSSRSGRKSIYTR